MAIEYCEIRSAATRELLGVIDTAKSVIWHSVYYGVGDFEIYAPCTAENITLLSVGNYVTRPNSRNVGIIEQISVEYSAQDGRMIAASGSFAKAILNRRIIYRMSGNSVSPTILKGNVEDAARALVYDNAIACTFDSARNIPALVLGTDAGISKTIIDGAGAAATKQVTFDNLLEYTDTLLQEYELGADIVLNDALKLAYTVVEAIDRTQGNAGGNEPVIFSQDFDNLISSQYAYDQTAIKNAALIGGAGEGTERFCAMLKNNSITGADRREIFVDAKNLSKTYKDTNDVEQTFSNSDYEIQLKQRGAEELSKHIIEETFEGEIDVTNGAFQYGVHFELGDKVTIEDAELGLFINPRILEITEVQDDDGYTVTVAYGK